MKLKQSFLASFGETAANTFLGFGLSLLLQWLYFDVYLGFPLRIGDNLMFAVVMTFVSLARGLTVRRLFEHWGLRAKLSAAVQAVLAERARQVGGEGYDAHHDEKHSPRDLALAAAAYLEVSGGGAKDRPPAGWPWDELYWNPKDIRRDLVRGTALGLAALDRLEAMRKPVRRRPF